MLATRPGPSRPAAEPPLTFATTAWRFGLTAVASDDILVRHGRQERGTVMRTSFAAEAIYESPTLTYYGSVVDRTAGIDSSPNCDSSQNVSPGPGFTAGHPSAGCGDAQQTK